MPERTAGARLRALIEAPNMAVLAGAYDGLSARLVERAGFDAFYFSGGLSSSSFPGLPDFGTRTLSEAAAQVAGAVAATSVPMLADGEAGYGSALSVQRTVREFERAGAAGLHLEDQDVPRRCGHYAGKTLVPCEEHESRILAALDAKNHSDFVIIARTDAIAVTGFEDALTRARAYARAGADAVFFDGVENLEQLQRIPKELADVPTMANMVEGGVTPFLAAKDLESMGYALCIYPCTAYFAALAAMRDVLGTLKKTGTSEAFNDRMATFSEWQDITGVAEAMSILDRFGKN